VLPAALPGFPALVRSAAEMIDVQSFVTRLSPDPVCDDCITDRLELPSREAANIKTRELGGTAGFERRRAACSLCLKVKLVICAKRRAGLLSG